MTPPTALTSWPAQLDPVNHDPSMQRLIEVYSKHGNSEEYNHTPPLWRYFNNGQEVAQEECLEELEPDFMTKVSHDLGGGPNPTKLLPGCIKKCPEPTRAFVPCCWRAGEIAAKRCIDPYSEFCREQIKIARHNVQPFPDKLTKKQLEQIKQEFRQDPGRTDAAAWADCGQCLDCWQPAANYQGWGSVQKALATAYFDEAGRAHHYRFGFIGSTDTHSAWPGSTKETKRMAEAQMRPVDDSPTPDYPSWKRVDNFLNPGGLAAVLARHRTRDDLWDSMKERNVYSTSGARIDLRARAVVDDRVVKMGSESSSAGNPTFYIKANGALVEEDICPYDDEPVIKKHLSREEFKRICGNQCYRVTDERTPISRIEVVKILQPINRLESEMADLERSSQNPHGLIIDPYYVEEIGYTHVDWRWTDTEFEKEPEGRSVAYYFRVIQNPTPGYNCNPIALLQSGKSCNLKDPKDISIEARINPQDGSKPESLLDIDDPCYSNPEDLESYCQERAWSSPFYIIKK